MSLETVSSSFNIQDWGQIIEVQVAESRQHQRLQQHANNEVSDLHRMRLEEEHVRNGKFSIHLC